MIPTFTICSLDRFCGMVDVYNYIIRVVNILTFIYPLTVVATVHDAPRVSTTSQHDDATGSQTNVEREGESI